ncbi:MAG TPA: glycogen debranching N-terminal domain-containing protein [Lapillicoccus sp.]|uniref:glycogen debranching N-terminal domain-containing protein n=1 Tax=Lapillicoccus sp. TaxID=1909287 RepID=UPI002F930B31
MTSTDAVDQTPDTSLRQPWLHDLSITVDGNSTQLSSQGGDVEPGSAQGFYVDDVRMLNCLLVRVAGEPASPVAGQAQGARAEFFGAARAVGDPGADPTVEVRRVRTLAGSRLVEEVSVISRATEPVRATLEIEIGCDAMPIGSVKGGRVVADQVAATLTADAARFATDRHDVDVSFAPAPVSLEAAGRGALARFEVSVDPGQTQTWQVAVTVARRHASGFDADPGGDAVTWGHVRVTADDPRLAPLVTQSLDDLRHLLLRDPLSPEDVFAAAGTPWYLTLFGRDSIWTARMMLPFGTELAAGTLRALARRQGAQDDSERAEQPGKIAHEVRRTAYQGAAGLSLPPLYYGTVDATALWVCLLVEAWRWGLSEAEVRELLPHLRAALGWITGPGQPDSDGLLKYLDTTGHGLANQGWKDSGDSMRFRDGRVAEGPIALVEAQAYAVEALLGAAELLEGLGEPGSEDARREAELLRERIQAGYWVDGADGTGRYLAMALDGQGRAVDGLGSNMGHVLGTGVLSAQEAQSVAEQVTGDELLDDFGIRTFGSGNGGFNPIGYHTGSVWTHDTAIVALGLAREGQDAGAATILRRLLSAGASFDYRYPELYSGLPMMGRPAPYPASCRPQAWSAASAAVLLSVAVGLQVDLPKGEIRVRPLRPAPFGAITVSGLRAGRAEITVTVDAQGDVSLSGVPDGLEVSISA